MEVGRDFFCHIKCNIIDMFCTSFFLPSQDGLRKVPPTQEMAGYQLYMYNDDPHQQWLPCIFVNSQTSLVPRL